MLKIAVVGDLSMNNPTKYDHVMSEAFKNADMVVQIGDMHPAYDITTKYLNNKDKKVLLAVPGNHDVEWDEKYPHPRQWVYTNKLVHIIGIDNSNDHLNEESWRCLATADLPENKNKFIFVVAHKPLSMILLPDGSESWHYMGEDGGNHSAQKLRDWLAARKNTLFLCGHYHEWTFQHTPYSDVIVEGRGGAAPQMGYTLLFINNDGWVLHKVDL